MTTTSTARKPPPARVKITLCEEAPVIVDEAEWPIVAEAKPDSDGPPLAIIVRQHADGRRIVYGYSPNAGFVVPPRDGRSDHDETVRAIKRVAGIIRSSALRFDCIARLPPRKM